MLGFNLLLHSVIIIELTQNIEGQLVNKLELKNFKNDITQLKIEGLDCSNPTEVTHSSLKQMCQQHKVIGNIEQNAEVAIIQSVDYRIREAYTCTMYVSELDVHCGIWSYMKLEQPINNTDSFFSRTVLANVGIFPFSSSLESKHIKNFPFATAHALDVKLNGMYSCYQMPICF